MSNSSQLYLLNEHDDLSFLLHISGHCIVGNSREKFKENLMSTFISRESPELVSAKFPKICFTYLPLY